MTAPVIALLGAESTGKTRLAHDLAAALQTRGLRTRGVPEYLRQWCEAAGRTPRPDEQAAIADAQQAAIDAAAADPDIDRVVADTTPLMTAVYSDLLFGDRSLYPSALQHLRRCSTVLLMGLDLPWVADGIQRDGPQVRAPVDAAIRTALDSAAIGFQVVYGQGRERLASALHAIESVAACARPAGADARFSSEEDDRPMRAWACLHCGDADCERRLFDRVRRSALGS